MTARCESRGKDTFQDLHRAQERELEALNIQMKRTENLIGEVCKGSGGP